MCVRTGGKQQRDVGAATGERPCKVVLRKKRGDDLQPAVRLGRLRTAAERTAKDQRGKERAEHFFHW